MYADRDLNFSAADPTTDPPMWHALRPEVRSSDLRWSDLKLLADRQLLRPSDYVWHPTLETWRPAGDVSGLFETPMAVKGEHEKAPPHSLKQRARHELQSYALISVYIWLIVSLLHLHEVLLANTYNFTYESQGRAIVTALILGKVVLIAEALRLGESLGGRFPALSVAIRAILFAAAILAFHACEEVVVGLWHGRSFGAVAGDVSALTIWRSGLLAIIMTIALIPYFLIKEIEKRTGQTNLLLVAFGLKR